MPTRIRKIRKFRGSRSHGWGQVGQHRGAGTRGGHGKTGGHKHHWTKTILQDTLVYGKHGFKRSWVERPRTLNVGELDEIVDQLLTQKVASKADDGIHINLGSIGVDKLLGKGTVRHKLILEVGAFSEDALQKIKAAEGKIVSSEN